MEPLDRTFRRWGAFCAVMFAVAAGCAYVAHGRELVIPRSTDVPFRQVAPLLFMVVPACLAILVGVGSRFRAENIRFILLAVGALLWYGMILMFIVSRPSSGASWSRGLYTAMFYASHFALVLGLCHAFGLPTRPGAAALRWLGWGGVVLGGLAGVVAVVAFMNLERGGDLLEQGYVSALVAVVLARRLYQNLRLPPGSADQGAWIRNRVLVMAGLYFATQVIPGLGYRFTSWHLVRVFSWEAASLTFDFLLIAAFLELMREEEPAGDLAERG